MKQKLFLPQIFSLAISIGSLMTGMPASAQATCEKGQPVQGCVRNFTEIAEEQKRIDPLDSRIQLLSRMETAFAPVNNRLLVMNLFGRHELTISYTSEEIKTTRNGNVTRNARICYSACPGENKVVFYHDEYGVFKALPKGLQVGRYKFYIEE